MSIPQPPSVALVAGASSGIGAASARALAALGTAVALVGRRAAELEKEAAAIGERGGRAVALPLDLAAPDGPAEAVVRAEETLGGPVELLLCSAATIRLAPVHETDPASWERQMRLNLTVPYLLAHHVLPGMRARRRGWIITIGSGVGATPVPGSGAYGVSKCALNRLTELIHEENRDHGVRTYGISPGWVDTRLAARPESLGVARDELLRPEDIAETVTWLVQRPAHIATGPLLRVEPAAGRADAAAAMTRHLRQGER